MNTPSPRSRITDDKPLPLEANLGRLEPVMEAHRTRARLDELFVMFRSDRRTAWGSVLPSL
jgi:hypothetical protein